jgi:hypothetical protein
MVLVWGFNPAEAARSFAGALAHDPGCLAALWGLAGAAGPNIKADMAAADAPQVDDARRRCALALAPGHPGANHAWVQLIEQSPAPERARVQAGRLRSLVPGSGHLLHMPAHIDMRLGDFAAAVRANERAIQVDRRDLGQVDAQGAYRVGYIAHNHHFLWAAASIQGLSAKALAAAREA